MELILDSISVSYKNKIVLNNISYIFKPGVYGLLGKNGAGKSTLLHAIFNKPDFNWQGAVFFNGKKLTQRVITEDLAYLPQIGGITSPLTVEKTLLLGMHSELSWRITSEQYSRVKNFLNELEEQLGIKELGSKKIIELSGGQRQLIYLAQCLIKKPRILLLDEPCTYLDIKNQLIFIDKIKSLSDVIVISTMHEINLALQKLEHILILNGGVISFAGRSQEISSGILRKNYEVNSVLLEKEEHRDFVFTNAN